MIIPNIWEMPKMATKPPTRIYHYLSRTLAFYLFGAYCKNEIKIRWNWAEGWMMALDMSKMGGFHSHRGTPSHHPLKNGIFHDINQPFWIPPMTVETRSENLGLCS